MLLTTGQQREVAKHLTDLVAPWATVDPDRHRWMPGGLNAPNEAKLGESPGFLSESQRSEVTSWWLAVRGGANTPNWDLASTCTLDGVEGLLLVEAKAHSGELRLEGKTVGGNTSNHERIGAAWATPLMVGGTPLHAVLRSTMGDLGR